MPSIDRPDTTEYATFYREYIGLVPDGPVRETLRDQIGETLALLKPLSEERARHRYAPGKWSMKEVLGHVADAERIFAYRALRIARDDATPLPGFDENAYVKVAGFDARPWRELLEDLRIGRQATLRLLETFDGAALLRRGTANEAPASARGLLYVIAGHERHHVKILKERYLSA